MESNSSKSFIDLKVISGKHIRSFNYFQKLQLYVQVYITTSDDNNKKNKVDDDQKQRTPADMDGDANPEWNHSMRFDFNHNQKDDDELFLQFDVRHHGNMFGDKTIGQVRIPFTDLIQDATSSIRFVSYEIRSPPPDSKPNGVLSFSYKVVRGGAASDSTAAAAFPQISGYSIDEEHPIPPQIQYPPLSSGAENGLSSLMTPSAAAFPQISGYSIVEEPPPPPQIQYPPLSTGAENGSTPSAAAFPQISGYSIVEEHPIPPPQIQYPPLSTENGLSSSPKIKYPKIDLDLDLDLGFKQDTWNNHRQPPYPPVQKPEQESDIHYDYYSRSESFDHHLPPPPPPWMHGGHYPPHPPPPPPFGFHLWGPHPRPHPHPDAYGVGHNYHGGQAHGPGAGWPNYWQQHEHNSFSSSQHSPSWNGR